MQNQDQGGHFDSSFEDEECDAESLASELNGTDDFFNDGGLHPVPERILAENHSRGRTWYLVKWVNCPVVRSSWEIRYLGFDCDYRILLKAWGVEKILQAQGKKTPFDVDAFNKANDEIDNLEKGRRNLRRWKRQLKGIRAAITAIKVD